MPRYVKKFVVFSDGAIYKYIPEDDDVLVRSGQVQLHDQLNSAKRYAKECIERRFQSELTAVDSLTYKDFP